MSEVGKVKIVQIIVDIEDGQFYAVALTEQAKELLVPYIQALSGGPIKIVHLPGVKMTPLSELGES